MERSQKLDVGHFELVLQDVELPMGLSLNALTLTGKNLHLENEPFGIEMPAPGKLRALVLQENLAAFLNKQAPGGLKDFKVELTEGKIHVQATMMIMKAVAVCNLRIHNGEALFVDLERVDVMGVGATNLVQNQLDKINPVIEVKDLPVKARLTDFDISKGQLVLYGEIYPELAANSKA
jgi:hypothetical protein